MYEEAAVADVVSNVVTAVKATAPAAGLTARAPLPVVHVNVVDTAAMAPVTVSTSTWVDVVAAVTTKELVDDAVLVQHSIFATALRTMSAALAALPLPWRSYIVPKPVPER